MAALSPPHRVGNNRSGKWSRLSPSTGSAHMARFALPANLMHLWSLNVCAFRHNPSDPARAPTHGIATGSSILPDLLQGIPLQSIVVVSKLQRTHHLNAETIGCNHPAQIGDPARDAHGSNSAERQCVSGEGNDSADQTDKEQEAFAEET